MDNRLLEAAKALLLASEAAADTILSPASAAAHLRPLVVDSERERYAVIALDTAGQIITSECLTVGTDINALVCPRQTLRWALTRDRPCRCIIVGHSHPSGNPTPSKEDHAVTRRLSEACKAVGIILHDHLVVTATKHYSFAEYGEL